MKDGGAVSASPGLWRVKGGRGTSAAETISDLAWFAAAAPVSNETLYVCVAHDGAGGWFVGAAAVWRFYSCSISRFIFLCKSLVRNSDLPEMPTTGAEKILPPACEDLLFGV